MFIIGTFNELDPDRPCQALTLSARAQKTANGNMNAATIVTPLMRKGVSQADSMIMAASTTKAGTLQISRLDEELWLLITCGGSVCSTCCNVPWAVKMFHGRPVVSDISEGEEIPNVYLLYYSRVGQLFSRRDVI